MNNKVSIIIPTYNSEKYIKETIDSCLNQTHNNVEVIVIDDCSSDRTIEILQSCEGKINLYLNENNQGISKNVNKGVSLSTGDYFILLGHDDILPDVHIEIMLQEFNDATVAVHCNSILIDGSGKQIGIARNDKKQMAKTANCMFELSINNFISSCGMIHKRDVFMKLGGWDEAYKQYGEWLYYIKELQYGDIKYTTKTKAFYRKHETNITNTFKKKDVRKLLDKYKQECRILAHYRNKNTVSENIKYFFNNFKLFVKSFK